MSSNRYGEGSEFEWQEDVRYNLRGLFGYRDFLPGRETAINAAMAGRDVILRLRTGGGKSLAFWLPACMTQGVTIVITPHIVLMQDQVASLQRFLGPKLQDAVAMIQYDDSNVEKDEVMSRLRRIANRKTTRPKIPRDPFILYVTPERISQEKFQDVLAALEKARALARIVIDEAHCIYQDVRYRSDYGKLKLLPMLFRSIPMTFVSATMPLSMRDDIVRDFALGGVSDGPDFTLRRAVWCAGPVFRPNHHIRVVYKGKQSCAETAKVFADEYLKNFFGQCGFVYCLTPKDTSEAADALRERLPAHIQIAQCHGRLLAPDKDLFMQQLKAGHIQIACVTTACSLGIDTPHVRFSVLLALPHTTASMFQEFGRIRHDGPAQCILYYNADDICRLIKINFGKESKDSSSPASETHPCMVALAELARYVLDCETCRHAYLRGLDAEALNINDNLSPCVSCDNCTRRPESQQYKVVTREAWHMLKMLERLKAANRRVTPNQLGQLVRGKPSKGLRPDLLEYVSNGATRLDLTQTDFDRVFLRLYGEGYIWLKPMRFGYPPVCIPYIQIGEQGYALARKSQLHALESTQLVIPVDSSIPAANQSDGWRLPEHHEEPPVPPQSPDCPSDGSSSTALQRPSRTSNPVTRIRRNDKDFPSRRSVNCPLCCRPLCSLKTLAGHIGGSNCNGNASDRSAVMRHKFDLKQARQAGMLQSVFEFACHRASERRAIGDSVETSTLTREPHETIQRGAVTKTIIRNRSRHRIDTGYDNYTTARPHPGAYISGYKQVVKEIFDGVELRAHRWSTAKQKRSRITFSSIERRTPTPRLRIKNAGRVRCRLCLAIFRQANSLVPHWGREACTGNRHDKSAARAAYGIMRQDGFGAEIWQELDAFTQRLAQARRAKNRARTMSPRLHCDSPGEVVSNRTDCTPGVTSEYEADARPSPVTSRRFNRPVALSSRKRKPSFDAESDDVEESHEAEYSGSASYYKRKRLSLADKRINPRRAARPAHSSLVELESAGSRSRDSSPEV